MRAGLRRTTTAGAAATAALLLGSLTPMTARAAESVPSALAAPAQVDVRTALRPEPSSLAPGREFQLNLSTDVVSGTVTELAVTIALPAGLTYRRPSDPNDLEYQRCVPSANGRTVTCRSLDAPHEQVWEQLGILVDKDVKPDSAFTITATTDIGDAVDTKPEDNTATATVKVRTGTDVGVSWQPPTVSVRPGRTVETKLVITNHGPGVVAPFEQAAKLHIDSTAFRTWPSAPDGCWADPNVLVCDLLSELAAGESRTFVLRWTFPKESGGRTFRVLTTLFSSGSDPDADNDRAELVLKVAKAPTTSPKPTPTPKPTPKPTTSKPTPKSTASTAPTPVTGGGWGVTPQGTGGGSLAETGSGPVTAVAAGAAALVLTGGALLVVRTRLRRKERDSQ